MLEKMRGSIGSVFIKILFSLLILSFMAWGIGDILNPSTAGQGVAEVGEREVTQQELAIAYQRQESYLRQRGLSPEVIAQLGLTNQVVNDLVNRALFDAESDELGMGVSDQTVVAEIHNQQSFQNSLGQFDRARFEMALQQIGYNETYYINALKREIATSQMVNSLASGAYSPKSLTSELFNWREEARTTDFLTYPVDNNIVVSQPNDTDIATYYDEAKEMFRAPELRDLTFIHISPTALAKTIDVSDEDIVSSYESRSTEFSTPERRHLQQMLLSDQETAQKAADMLAAGRDFAEVAMEIANVDESTMDLGFLTRDTVPDDQLAAVAFDLPLNQASAPTEGLFGWFIVRAIDIQENSTMSLDVVRERIKLDIAIERATDRVFEISNEIDDALAGGLSMEEAADKSGLTTVSLKRIDARGYANSKIAAVEIPTDPKFIQTAFETEDGTDSLVEELNDNSFFSVRVDNITESHIRDLAEVRQDIIDFLVADRQMSATEELVKEAVNTINEGGELSTIAASLGFDVKHSNDVKRNGQTISLEKLPDVGLSKLFNMEIGKADYVNTGADFIILVAKSKKEANANADNIAFKAIEDQLTISISNDIIEQFNNALKERHDVTINRFVINEFEQRLQY